MLIILIINKKKIKIYLDEIRVGISLSCQQVHSVVETSFLIFVQAYDKNKNKIWS